MASVYRFNESCICRRTAKAANHVGDPVHLARSARTRCVSGAFLPNSRRRSRKSTAANVGDVTQGHRLLYGDEADVFADAGYQGAMKRPEATSVAWHVAGQAPGSGQEPSQSCAY